jgi:phosphatidylinositol glycan class B
MRLWALLLLALIPRLWAAFHSVGFDHPNENYRLLEPLASLAGWGTRLPWEWKDGLLSQLPVLAHAEVLKLLTLAGIEGSLDQLIALRVIYAVLSLSVGLAIHKLVIDSGANERAALTAAAIWALWPEFVFRSVRLMDYSLESCVLAFAILAFPLDRRAWLENLIAGAILSLSFFVRPQSGLSLLALALLLLFTRRVRAALLLTAAYGGCVFLLANWESRITGDPLLSPFLKYVNFNLLKHGAAAQYGIDPWHRYFSEAAKAVGFAPLLLLPWAFARGRPIAAALLFFVPFTAHALIGHKEGRFIFPYLWLIVPMIVGGLASGLEPLKKSSLAIAVALGVIGFGFNLDRIVRRFEAGSEVVRQWSELGRSGYPPAQANAGPLLILGDPDFLPGGFFLRYPAGLCYQAGLRREGGGCGVVSSAPPTLTSAGGRWTLSGGGH